MSRVEPGLARLRREISAVGGWLGEEAEIYRGAGESLRKRRPKVICEAHPVEHLRALGEFFREASNRVSVLEKEERFSVHIEAGSRE